MENIFIRRSLCLTWIHILWRWDTTWLLNVGRILLLILFRKLSLWVSRREIGSKALHLIWRFSRLRDEGYDDFEIHWKPYGEEWSIQNIRFVCESLWAGGFPSLYFNVIFPWCFLFHCFFSVLFFPGASFFIVLFVCLFFVTHSLFILTRWGWMVYLFCFCSLFTVLYTWLFDLCYCVRLYLVKQLVLLRCSGRLSFSKI